MPERARGGAWKWVVGTTLALVAAVAGFAAWARHSPFDAAFRELERSSAGDPAVYLAQAIRDRSLDSFAAAARASSDPGYAAIWCSEAFDTDPPPAGVREAALERWAKVDPENGVVDLVRARSAIERRDIEGAVALLDRGLRREKPALYGHFSYHAHLALQERLGTRDAMALLRAEMRSSGPPFWELRQTLRFAHGVAEQAAWEGRFDEAAARARALREFSERLAARSSADVDRSIAGWSRKSGADLEARLALLAGDVVAARALREADRARDDHDAFVGALNELAFTDWTNRTCMPGFREPEGVVESMIASVRIKLRGERIFRRWTAPEGEYEYLRWRGAAARGPRPERTVTPLDVALRDPGAFGPAAPEGPPPPSLVRWLTERPEDEMGNEFSMAAWVARPLAQYGRRALPALERFLAQPATPSADLAALLPVFVRAGHEDAVAIVREVLAIPLYEDSFGPPAAAAMLKDESFVEHLEFFATREHADEDSLFAVDRALRAIRGRGIDPPP